MKKLLATVLILVLCAVSLAEGGDMTSLVRAGGFEPVASENKSGILRCDYTLTGERTAAMVWTDAAQQYTLSGDSDALSKLYRDALELGGWESCRFIVNGEAKLSFGAESDMQCAAIEEYAGQVSAALGVQGATAAPSVPQAYVLNERSKKFHLPDCSGIVNMSPKNRRDFTGTREELIASGYTPCGTCKP
jgi:hypothetical protein